jgi:ArsR family transcriptional regulator
MVSRLRIDESAAADVCATAAVDSLPVDEAIVLAGRLKALAEPTRLRLLTVIASHEGREACVCDLTEPVNLSQSTVSHHLKILVDAGFLTRHRRGAWAFYALVPGAVDDLTGALLTSVDVRST